MTEVRLFPLASRPVHTPSREARPPIGLIHPPAGAPPLCRRPRDAQQARDAPRLAFDAADLAAGLATFEDLDRHFRRTLHPLGFDVFFGLRLERRAEGLGRHIVGGCRHRLWESRYAANNYLNADPVVAEMLRSSEPAFWSELSQRRGTLRPEERRVLVEAARFGMTDGFLFALHRPKGLVTGVVMAGSRIDPGDPDTRTAACLLAGAYDAAARRISLQAPVAARSAPTRLTERQVECLRWVAAGKSSAEIAIVLQLSRKTVDEHIDNACRVFGVNTRVQAVIRAISLEIITA